MVIVSLLLLALLVPGTALAEGQKISLKNFKWSGGGTCPEKEGKLYFSVTGQWCEVQLKNENLVEEISVEREEAKVTPECNFGEKVLCVATKVPLNKPECEEGKTKLKALGGVCYNTLQYFKKPASKGEVTYRVETMSTGHVGAAVELSMLFE